MDTYGELKTQIANWLNREDIASDIPMFVRRAEADIYRELCCPDNHFTATYNKTEWRINENTPIAATDGIAEVLPPNFSSLKLVTWNGYPMDSVTDTDLAARLFTGYDQKPKVFCITARKVGFSSAIDSDPANWDTDDELVYSYYGTESLDSVPTWQVAVNPVESPVVSDITPQGLTQADGNTTRMLQRNPDIYLNGCLYHASLFLKDDAAAAKWGGLFRGGIEALKFESKRNMYAGSPKQVRSAY